MAKWLERPPREREVMGSIPVRDRPKSLKLVVVAFPPWRSGLWEWHYDWPVTVRIMDCFKNSQGNMDL